MVLPALLALGGAAMSLPTIIQGITDLADSGLSEKEAKAEGSHLALKLKNYMQQQLRAGRSQEEVLAEVESAFARGQSDIKERMDTPDVSAGQAAMAALGLIPGVGLARGGAAAAKAVSGGTRFGNPLGQARELSRAAVQGRRGDAATDVLRTRFGTPSPSPMYGAVDDAVIPFRAPEDIARMNALDNALRALNPLGR